MIQLNIWICDDEQAVIESIYNKIKIRYPSANIQTFNNGNELLSISLDVDILYLDIEMPDINGIEVARKLRAQGLRGNIIFVTAHDKYVFEAFDVQAFHYLVKPFDAKKFYQILQEASQNRTIPQPDPPYILIKSGFEMDKVFHEEIYYIEVQGRKIYVHTEQNTYSFNGKMKDLEEILGYHFFRIHRSYLVNLKFISRYDKQQITLDNGVILILSQKKYSEFAAAYLQYIKNKGQFHT